MRDGFSNVPDQLAGVAALAVLSADLEEQLGMTHIASVSRCRDGADRC